MGASAFVDFADLTVNPGEETSRQVRIVNNGRVVDQFTIDVVGAVGEWATAEPATLNLLPGAEGETTVFFRPPRSSEILPGESSFGLRVMSREDTEGSLVQEGTVTVGEFTDVDAEVIPQTVRARSKGKFEIAVDNLGNTPADVDIDVDDEEDLIRFKPARTAHTVPPGETSLIRLRAIPRKRFFKGPDKPLRFTVTVTPRAEGEPITSSAKLVQRPLLPPGTLPVLVAAIVALIAFIILWQTLLKPTLQSAARQAAAAENQQLAADVQDVKEQAQEAGSAAEKAGVAADQAGTAAEEARVAAGLPPAGNLPGAGSTVLPDRFPSEGSGGKAIDFRIATTAQPVTTTSFQLFRLAVPEGKAYYITDVVMQNPAGDSGVLQIRRGDTVLIEVGMNNFRDLDYHFVQAIKFSTGKDVVLAVNCLNPGTTACTPSVYFGGREQNEQAPAPAGTP